VRARPLLLLVSVGVVVSAGAVVVVGVAVDDVGLGGAATAVDGGAVGDFDLDGGVVDAEVVTELMVHAVEEGFAVG